jgi:sterol desaturase/sphingolipid hydroxylase (fatty acid hydroxylase superfamily)
MQLFDILGAAAVFAVFITEFIIIQLHTPDKKLVKDMLANCMLGICILLTGVFEKGMEFAFFTLVYCQAFIKPEPTWMLWIAAFLSCEFVHYAYHWLGHKTRLFWAAHVTHHSSEFLNFSTGLRTNFIHLFYRFLFWSPLCLMGIPPSMVLLFESISAIQNYLVHTEKIGKLGVLDWIFNTPSNHRVHHGSNPEYIDKNLGGILMIYDHLFGTYAKETSRPVYGITHNLNSSNPFIILFHEYIKMFDGLKKNRGLLSKIRYLFSRPLE